MGRLFGTDGVRGVANTELTGDLAYGLGRAGAHVLAGEAHHMPRILVGKDTRRSCDMLEAALVAGICSAGADAVLAGVVPTPAVAWLLRAGGFDAGVVISASHNPAEFNGIKFFSGTGYKLPDALESRIEDILLDQKEEIPHPIGSRVGTVSQMADAAQRYAEFAAGTVKGTLEGLKVAIDCANGAASATAPMALRALGAQVLVLNDAPDGMNINADCGSTHMGDVSAFVRAHACDVGLAFDGDADRVLAVDEQGNLVDGDRIMAIIALSLKRQGRLANNTIVATVMSNLGLDVMAREQGLRIEKTKVGDRYVLERMLAEDHVIGGEQSGHIILRMFNTTGDGLVTGLQLLKAMKDDGRALSEMASVMQIFPQVLRNARVSNAKKHHYLDDGVIAAECQALETLFHGEGRVLIRPSGTEPLVRVMIEGRDQTFITQKAAELAALIEARLG
jgi:phosphoglucosamine mutase